jgi:RNA polymerase sigma-70 factor (ECF subfamily)
MERGELEAGLEREHPDAFAWALRCCKGRREDAEDALQSAYERILTGRARFAGRSSFRTWLFGVVRRTAQEQRRRGWLRLVLLRRRVAGETSGSGSENSPAVTLAEREQSERIGNALERLSKRQREILHLVFYQELSVQEAALVLGMPVGTARTHYERGKAKLRDLLQGEDLR